MFAALAAMFTTSRPSQTNEAFYTKPPEEKVVPGRRARPIRRVKRNKVGSFAVRTLRQLAAANRIRLGWDQ